VYSVLFEHPWQEGTFRGQMLILLGGTAEEVQIFCAGSSEYVEFVKTDATLFTRGQKGLIIMTALGNLWVELSVPKG